MKLPVLKAAAKALEAKRATNKGRARQWQAQLERGCVLTFKANDGAAVTAGPYRTAVPTDRGGFALFRYGGRFAGEYHDNARGIALRIVEHVGRKRPTRTTCPRGK